MNKVLFQKDKIDATFKHPFTMVLAGPSGSGKSTWVSELMTRYQDFIDEKYDYVYIMIGTLASENYLFSNLVTYLKNNGIPRSELWEINEMFKTDKELSEDFPAKFKVLIEEHKRKKQKGCIIIDDLMKEMSQNDILMDLFTKKSSHNNLSVIYITQNLFFQGKKKNNSTTIFRNIKYLVLFYSKVDKSTLKFVVQRISVGTGNRKLYRILDYIMKKNRYVVLNLDLKTTDKILITTNTFEKVKLFPKHKKLSCIKVITPNF